MKEFPGKWDITEDKTFKNVKIHVDFLEYVSVERRFNEPLSSKTITKVKCDNILDIIL